MESKEIEAFIDTEEMKEYILEHLMNRGFIPKDSEINAITDIVFDYLLNKEIVEEVFDED
jgi:hypothetical protein